MNKYIKNSRYYFLIILFAFNPLVVSANQDLANSKNSPLMTLLVLGDSLSASFGMERSQGWVSLLSQKLSQHRYPVQVINASISGETTQGGLQRLPALLKKHKPSLVIVELGGNDGLRGLKLSMIESNLQRIIKTIKSNNAEIMLTGIRLPPNYGQNYTEKFYKIYSDLADRENITLVPFIMDGVATSKQLMQADGIHPTREAQPILLDNVWQKLQPLLNDTIKTTQKL